MELRETAKNMLTSCLAAKPGETLLVITDDSRVKIGTAIYEAGKELGCEAYIAPLEDGSNGEMIIDGSMVGVGKLSTPLHVTVRDGRLRAITGEGSEKLGILLANERNSTLGELGIGTNMAAILNGIILEDEKVYGTVHVAFGTNTSFGGTNKADCHMDGIILKPTLYLDGRKIIDHGEFLV